MAYISSTWNTTNTYIKYRLVVDLLSQDINANTSTINVQLQAWRTNTGYTTYGTGTSSVNVEGSQHNQGISSSQTITYNSYTVLYNANHTISHNADGTKSPNIGGYFIINSIVNGGWNYFSFALPTIPRASTVSATDANIEATTSINIGRYSTSFTHTLEYAFGSLTGTIATGVETSYGWTVPSSFYAQIPNALSGTCTVTCKTYNGATLIGTSQTTFAANVNQTTNKPDVSATIVDSNSTTVALTGDSSKFVKYISNAQFSITATAKNSSTITSRSIVCGGLSSTSASGTLTGVESGTFVVSATDSRSIPNSATYNKALVEYVNLSINTNLYRTQPTNNQIGITYSGNYFNGSFGAQANTLTVKYRYREAGTSTWSSYTTITPTISGSTYSGSQNLSQTFDYTRSYEFEVVAIDKVYTSGVISAKKVSQGIPVFNWDRTLFKTNVATTVSSLTVGSKSLLDLTYPVGAIYMSVVNTSPATLFGGTWAVWGTGRVPVAVDTGQTEFNTVEKTGGHKLLQAHGHEVRVNSFAGDLGIAISQGGGDGSWYGVQDYPEASYHYTNPYGSASSFYASSTGGGNAQNLQPYITCYMWKRTA